MLFFQKTVVYVLCYFLLPIVLWQIVNLFHSYKFRFSSHYQSILPQPSYFNAVQKIQSFDSNLQHKLCGQGRTKIMFAKNYKVASTTLSSIVTQIATHYHKYEILYTGTLEAFLNRNHKNLGYSVSHVKIESVRDFQTLFPNKHFFWVSTTRNVADQVNSLINYRNVKNEFQPSNFYKVLDHFKKRMKNNEKSHFHMPTEVLPLWEGGTSIILNRCRAIKIFEEFRSCAVDVFNHFDLIIPVNRMNKGIIMLHKLTCLPLSDFASLRKKVSSSHFKVSDQNMSEILKFHEQSIWFFNYTLVAFDKKFEQFQAQHCASRNCKNEILQLEEENAKLEQSCGVNRSNFNPERDVYRFQMDWKKLAGNSSLALRCISFAIDERYEKFFIQYNKIVSSSSQEKEDVAAKIAAKWLKIAQEDISRDKLNYF